MGFQKKDKNYSPLICNYYNPHINADIVHISTCANIWSHIKAVSRDAQISRVLLAISLNWTFININILCMRTLDALALLHDLKYSLSARTSYTRYYRYATSLYCISFLWERIMPSAKELNWKYKTKCAVSFALGTFFLYPTCIWLTIYKFILIMIFPYNILSHHGRFYKHLCRLHFIRKKYIKILPFVPVV